MFVPVLFYEIEILSSWMNKNPAMGRAQASLRENLKLKTDIKMKSSFVVTTCFYHILPVRLRLKKASSIMKVRACTQYLTSEQFYYFDPRKIPSKFFVDI